MLLHFQPAKMPLSNTNSTNPITCSIIGAGDRASIYAQFSQTHPNALKIVAAVEPNKVRLNEFAQRFGISPSCCFEDSDDFFRKDRMADFVLIASPDYLHYEHSLKAIERGYHILAEKPLAQTWEQCQDIAQRAKRANVTAGICYVLRYHQCYQKIKSLIDSKELGEIVTISHFEPVGLERMAHAFVRGNWRKSSDSVPMILSKSGHDLDLIRWLIGKRCRSVSSFGSLKWFKSENAPAGSAKRCTDGCQVEATCPYSAKKIYLSDSSWHKHFDCNGKNATSADEILSELTHGPYGRCVYHCDNDVVDHQIVSLLFEDDITVNFSMVAFTKEQCRQTRIMLTNGEIVSDELSLTCHNFSSNISQTFTFDSSLKHGGGDHGLLANFIDSVASNSPQILIAHIDDCLSSHVVALSAEESRLSNRLVDLSHLW